MKFIGGGRMLDESFRVVCGPFITGGCYGKDDSTLLFMFFINFVFFYQNEDTPTG